MDQKMIEELREKYIKNPPEGMTAKLVKNMSDVKNRNTIIEYMSKSNNMIHITFEVTPRIDF